MNEVVISDVLLVEDDLGDALLFEEMLEQQGCKPHVAKAVRLSEAIDHLTKATVQIILLDLSLPDSSGLSTLTRIMDVASDTPIVLLTGLSDEHVGIDAVRAGAQDYLVKGDVDGRLLKRSMYYAIQRKKMEISLRQALELFEKQARIDFLTGIYNRLMFSELVEAERQRAIRYKANLSLVMFDLDHFKNINDTYGHATGDYVLKEVAGLVNNNIRAHDILCRWGGEEFMLLTPGDTLSQAQVLAEKLCGLIRNHDFGERLQVTASFGITQFLPQDKIADFTGRADKAMYAAKQKGRNRCEAYQQGGYLHVL